MFHLKIIIMWIAILISTIYFFFFKKKKKQRKNTTKIVWLLCILSLNSFFLKAQSNNYRLSGKVDVFTLKGELYIYLIDKKCFDIPFSGIDTIICKANKTSVFFCFKNVPPGKYAIRCFQDLNHNQKLDKKFFVPAEPYGFSWQTKKKFPFDFYDIAFFLDNDQFIKIKLDE